MTKYLSEIIKDGLNPKYYLFVYGTLKRGHHNHVLLKDSKYLGLAITKEPYLLFNYGVPIAIKSKNSNLEKLPILGELYLINEITLSECDYLEGHPLVYCRQKADVINLKDSKEYKAYIYFYIRGKAKINSKYLARTIEIDLKSQKVKCYVY